jgi:hypothetical protein
MTFSLSFTPTGAFSATEARDLMVFDGSIFCATGNWENSGMPQGPQVIRQDAQGGPWAVDFEFPNDYTACAALGVLNFPSANVSVLACGFFGLRSVAVRREAGYWTVSVLGGGKAGGSQVRSFCSHTDAVTKTDMVFAGSDAGIYSGTWDEDAGIVVWGMEPELSLAGLPPMFGGHPQRVMSMARDAGVLYATVGQAIYERVDGAKPAWKSVWVNAAPGNSQSGLRGMTWNDGELWVGVEGTQSRIVSIEPDTSWDAQTLYDVSGPKNAYCIVAYNNFCMGEEAVLAGLDGIETGAARYLTLVNGVWTKRTLPALSPHPTVSCRSILVSPFNSNAVLFAGYDCNGKPAHNTAWIIEGTIADALSGT